MPIYEYRCEKCGTTFEKLVRSMFTVPEIECPACHSKECKKSISLFGTSFGGGKSAAAPSSCGPTGG